MPYRMQDHRPLPPPPTRKSPVGLMPQKIFQEHRIMEILAALHRYTQAGMVCPEEWLDELEGLLQQRFPGSFY